MSAIATAPAGSTAVETWHLSKTFWDFRRRKTVAVQDVSFTVPSGSIFGLLGRNGAGKTTLVKILLGLIHADCGSAKILGEELGNAAVRRRMGYLPEQIKVPEYLKVEQFLRYMGKLNGLDSSTLSRKIPEVLDLTGLKGIKKRVGDYSKGMVQRLALAQAILNEPEVLFLDEPTDGLDPLGRKQVRDLLLQGKQQGRTIFLNSHLLSEIELVCDKVLIMDKGQIVREGSPREFMAATGEVKISLAEMNGAVRAAISSVTEPIRSSGNTLWIRPADRAQLNIVIDRLRAAQVEIESVEPVRSTLEESFLQIVSSGGESQ